MDIPILASNMDTVIGEELAHTMTHYGSIPIFHRFTDFEQKIKWIAKFPNCFISAGIKEDELKESVRLVEMHGLRGVCIDIAHGHDSRMKQAIDTLKRAGAKVIAGNVCSRDAYKDLCEWGADAVKVGVGPGAACTTRATTGFGVPQFTAVYEIGKEAQKLHVPFIADGGISGPDDIVKALAAGASSVMMGKMFAACAESAAKKSRISDHRTQARYRGQASAEFQKEYFGEVKEGTVPEGEAMWTEVTGTGGALLTRLTAAISSGLNYGGARDIYELQRKCRGQFMPVGSGYSIESGVRG
jgi:IMP dehydrogenase